MTRRPVSLALLALLALYHLANLLTGSWLDPRALLRSSLVEIEASGRRLASVSTWRVNEGEHFSLADFSSRAWRDIGYVLGYYAGRVPDFLLLGERRPFQRVYVRAEAPFQLPARARELERAHLPESRILVTGLERRGVTVVLLPVPSKLAIERARLPRRLPRAVLWSSDAETPAIEDGYAAYRALVDALPEQTPDLHRRYREYLDAHSDADLFVPADTHWSSLGIALAAGAVIDNLRARGWDLSEPEVTATGESRKPDPQWDLLKPMQLPGWFVRRAGAFAWREPLYTVTTEMKRARPGRLIVAGTCYSERLDHTGHGLADLLAAALHRPRVQVGVTAGGAGDSLWRWQRMGRLLEPGDLLVWEFPLRGVLAPGEKLPELAVIGI